MPDSNRATPWVTVTDANQLHLLPIFYGGKFWTRTRNNWLTVRRDNRFHQFPVSIFISWRNWIWTNIFNRLPFSCVSGTGVIRQFIFSVAGVGYDPTTFRLWAWRATSCSTPQYIFIQRIKSQKQGSNPRPSHYKWDALPSELFWRIIFVTTTGVEPVRTDFQSVALPSELSCQIFWSRISD